MNELLDLHPGKWKLHIFPRQHLTQLLTACAHLGERGPLIVLDCGRQYNPAIVVEAANGRTEITDRIHSQRAFICYEVVKLLQKTPTGKTPILVLDLLSSFYDENVQFRMRQFLLERAVMHLERLSKDAGLAVFVQPPPNDADAANLFKRLEFVAPQVVTYETVAAQPKQGKFF
jgi:hypothetical protein